VQSAVAVIVPALILVGLFLLFRVIVLWYWKVNEIVELLRAINASLRTIAGEGRSIGSTTAQSATTLPRPFDSPPPATRPAQRAAPSSGSLYPPEP
jgi:hypothetical protein